MFKLQRTVRFYFLMLKRQRGDPFFLSRGVALGVFIGITPTIPLHTVAIIALAYPFKASKISGLLASVLVSNPVMIPFCYTFSWLIGDFLLPGVLTREKIDAVMELISTGAGFMTTLNEMGSLGLDALVVLLVGGCILALPFTVLGYFISLNFFQAVDKRKRLGKTDKAENDQAN